MHAKALALAALLLLPNAAGAQLAITPVGTPSPTTVVPSPLQDLPPGDTLGDRASELWSNLTGMFGFSLGGGSFARSQAALSQNQAREDFTWLMEIAGYKLKEIESVVGLIPSVSLTFGMARELTEGDRAYLDRMLDRHARRHPGTLSAIQRTIVRAIIDASEIGGFSVEKVEVDLFPLPQVKLVMAPSDAPLGIEASRIMRSIDRLNQRVQAGTPRSRGGGFELLMPGGRQPVRPVSLDH